MSRNWGKTTQCPCCGEYFNWLGLPSHRARCYDKKAGFDEIQKVLKEGKHLHTQIMVDIFCSHGAYVPGRFCKLITPDIDWLDWLDNCEAFERERKNGRC